jgi:predicted Rossmann-fold nucleotide-binding protein
MRNSRSTDARLPRFGVVAPVRNEIDDAAPQRCWGLGTSIATAGCTLLTRACAGLTHAAVLGARSAGGQVIGISPAASLKEHVEVFAAPWRDYDVLLFTGRGTGGHELLHLRNIDVLVLVGGAMVTFDELALACEERKLIGILGSSRRTTEVPAGVDFIQDDDPERLVATLLWRFISRQTATPSAAPLPAAEVCS